MPGSATMLGSTVGRDERDEARLARQAGDGDPASAAALYDLHGGRIFNFCDRVLGSTDAAAQATREAFAVALTRRPAGDPEPDLFVRLLAAAHVAAGDALAPDRRAGVDADAEPARAFADPERAALLSSLQADVRSAGRGLSHDHRAVLALRELEGLSYDQIAEVTGTAPGSVAELISRARVRLHDELRGAEPVAVATSADCERALPLIALRQDGRLRAGDDREWLRGHLAHCAACRARREAAQEAAISYRAWLPVVPPAALRDATIARIADLGAADSGVAPGLRETPDAIATRSGPDPDDPDGASTELTAVVASAARPGGRWRFALGGALLLLLLAGFGTALVIGSAGRSERRPARSRPARSVAAPSAATSSTARPGPTRAAKRPARPAGAAVTSTPAPASTPTASTPAPRSVARTPSAPRRVQTPVSRTPVGGSEQGSASVPTRTVAPAPTRSPGPTTSAPKSPPATSTPAR